jgi:hypothetical protein
MSSGGPYFFLAQQSLDYDIFLFKPMQGSFKAHHAQQVRLPFEIMSIQPKI